MTTSTAASPDKGTVEGLFYEIQKHIKAQQEQQHQGGEDNKKTKSTIEANLHSSLQALHNASSPKYTMDLLALYLFTSSSSSMETDESPPPLSSHDAFLILTVLVSHDKSSDYLIAASRAVKSTAELIAASSSSSSSTIEVSDEVLSIIVAQLTGQNVEVSSNASITLLALTKKLGKPISDRIIPSIVQTWKQQQNSSKTSSQSSTICIRCASTIIDIACLGDAMMECAVQNNAMSMMVYILEKEVESDPLMVMSILDLLEKMANTLPMHGKRSKWLCSDSVLDVLLSMAGGGGNGYESAAAGGTHDPILGGPALRLLSCLCRLAQRDESLFFGGNHREEELKTETIHQQHRQLLVGFHRALHSFDSNLSGELERLAFIDAVSSFAASSPDAMAIVLDDPTLCEGWLSLSVAQPKLKSVILHSVANAIDPPKEMDANGDTVLPWNVPSNQIAMRLFDALGRVNDTGGDIHDDATKLVLANATSPMVETRLGSYALLKAIAKRGVGAQVLLSHAGFFEFLTHREISLETTKEGKEAKHDIVVAILESDAKGLLADDIVKKLEHIERQGPHYVKAVPWELATE